MSKERVLTLKIWSTMAAFWTVFLCGVVYFSTAGGTVNKTDYVTSSTVSPYVSSVTIAGDK